MARFPDSAWQFHRIPPEEREAAWLWELEIEHKSGAPYWLDLETKCREKVRRHVNDENSFWPIKEHGFGDYLGRLQKDMEGTGWQIHFIGIEWSEGKEAVKKALCDWVDSDPAGVFSLPIYSPCKGGQRGIDKKLADLAIYRVAAFKVNWEKAKPFMTEMLGEMGKDVTNSEQWGRAKRSAEKRIQDIEEQAKHHHLTKVIARL